MAVRMREQWGDMELQGGRGCSRKVQRPRAVGLGTLADAQRAQAERVAHAKYSVARQGG